jgi:hypothetical protein
LDELEDGVVREPNPPALPEHQFGCLESSGPALHSLVIACPRPSPKSLAQRAKQQSIPCAADNLREGGVSLVSAVRRRHAAARGRLPINSLHRACGLPPATSVALPHSEPAVPMEPAAASPQDRAKSSGCRWTCA